MTTLRRVRVTWDGLGGLPGLSTFYYGVASPNVSDLVTFFNAVKVYVPSGLTWTIPSSGDELDDVTGDLTGSWTGTGGGSVAATGSTGPFAAGTGVIVRWRTGIVADKRRVQGRTFIAPTVSGMFNSSGGIGSTPLATLQAAAAAYVSSGVAKGIWHQPKKAPGGIGPDRPGLYCAINGSDVGPIVSSLRSRRR